MGIHTITTTTERLPLLRLMQLISPSLPIGRFTYSQGLEWAAEAGWVDNRESLQQWLSEQIDTSLARVDLPLLLRFIAASKHQDLESCREWTDVLLACRETAELRQEEQQRGRALASLCQQLSIPGDVDWYAELKRTQLACFAHAAVSWSINPETILTGYAWSWLENLVLAAVKIIPLGQTSGQVALFRLAERLPAVIERAQQLQDDELGASSMALAMASSRHETQYTRLFRS